MISTVSRNMQCLIASGLTICFATRRFGPSADDCDFESSAICQYTQDRSDDIDWIRSYGANGTGPSVDFTYGTANGYYMYMDTAQRNRGKGRLISPTYPSTTGRCLNFAYYMYGPRSRQLNVYMKRQGRLGPAVWLRSGNLGNHWNTAQITLNSNTQFQVVFEGITGYYGAATIAIDDVQIKNGPCPPVGSCDFEHDYCGWSNDQITDNFDFTMAQGRTASLGTGPTADHTLGNSQGTYIYIEASSPRKAGDKSRLRSSTLPQTTSSCLSFWYNMYGRNIGYLKIYTQTGGFSSSFLQIDTLSGDQGRGWKQRYVNVTSTRQFSFIVEGVVGNGYLGDLALDDMSYRQGACPSAAAASQMFHCGSSPLDVTQDKVCDFKADCHNGFDEANCGSCNFDSQGLCGLSDISVGSFRWQRDNRGTPTNNTGPAVDHTQGTRRGYYMYIDASNGRYNSLATLATPALKQASSTCQFTFWYHMYGTSIGQLSVRTKIGSSYTQLWSLRGSQGNMWKQATVDVGRLNGPFQLQIQARRSFSVTGDIAIDDTNFTNCALPQPQATCPPSQFHCNNGACVDRFRLCDYSDDCGDNSDELYTTCANYTRCTFQATFCTWTQDSGDKFNWLLRRGTTSTYRTGPNRDHSSGVTSGFYAYIETSYPRRPGDAARLLSPVWNTATSASNCYFVFYYNMYGRSMGALNVYMRTQSSITSIWRKTQASAAAVWTRASIPLMNSQPFQIIVEGVRGSGNSGDIGLDDTIFSPQCTRSATTFPQPFTVPPTSATTVSPQCGSGKFQCKTSKTCIPMNMVCDFSTDCSDGTDEANCGPCTFESDLCMWSDINAGRYTWSRSIASSNRGPATDHTMGTAQGHYGLVNGANGVFFSQAILSSPALPMSSASCEMWFYYNMNGRHIGSLTVSANVNGSVTPLWTTRSSTGTQAGGWRKGVAYIGHKLGPIAKGNHVEFEARTTRGFAASTTADVAIDDIVFHNCNPQQKIPNVACNFDRDFCTWKNPIDNIFNWKRNNGTTMSVGTGPSADHTTRYGSYIYIETSRPRRPGDIARLDSPILSPVPVAGICLSFWYYMFGTDIGRLNVYMQNNYNRTLFWSKIGAQGDKWIQAQRTIYSSIDYALTFEGVVGNGYHGDIAVDDINISNGPCSVNPACGFQTGFCQWKQSTNDNFDWTRARNGTSSAGTGPEFDHTYGSDSGYYVYIETSSPRRTGDQAILISPQLDTATRCFSFWYHMSGATIGSFAIQTATPSSTGIKFGNTIWSRQGDQGNMWRHGQVTITPQGQPYMIQLKATRGRSYTGDIALDDVQIKTGSCPPAGFCNFELDTCGWMNTRTGDNFDWLRDNGGTPTVTTGPRVDHTLGTPSGYYMFIETSGPRRAGDKAWFISDYQPGGLSYGGCLTFWYHMYGAGIGSLNVYTQTGNSSNSRSLKLNLVGNQGNVWKFAKVNVANNDRYRVLFEGIRGGNYSGDIALDDVTLSREDCGYMSSTSQVLPATSSPATYPPSMLDCTFEQGLCTWTQDTTNDFNWSVKSGTTATQNTGPSSDHTLQNRQGHYYYIEVSRKRPNSTARLVSTPQSVGSSGLCFKFWYNMHGAHVNSLNIYSRQSGANTRVWTKSGERGIGWHYGQVYIGTPGQIQVVVEGVAGVSYNGDIAIDDLSSNTGLCPPLKNCDFEDGMCGYIQDKNEQFDWSMHSGSTGTSATGPTNDHTDGTPNGHYLYIESSSPQHPGDRARVDSPVWTPTSGSCLTFWYSMNGVHIGTLNVYKSWIGNRGQPIWTMTGNQGLQWHMAQVTVVSNSNFRLTFEGIVGQGYKGDIALDDIMLSPVRCPSPGSCNFETDMCTWTNANSGDTFDWERAQGSTTSVGTGPRNDHTLMSPYGTYLYIEASRPRIPNDKAWLVSTTFQNNTNYCLTFWYHMSGQGMGTLNVNVWPYNTGPQQTHVLTVNGDQGPNWKQGQAPISPQNVNYRVVIEAIRGSTINSDIAIDDIVVTPGNCSGSPTNTPANCSYMCNGTCIASSMICDFNIDCQNARDEKNCGYNCNFENGTCKWSNRGSTSYIWMKGQGSSSAANRAPNFDRTTLSPNGHFMYLMPSSRATYSTGQYMSPVLQQASASCEFTFYYHMAGTHIGQLGVKLLQGSLESRLFYLSGDQGGVWRKATIQIGRVRSPFQLQIYGSRSLSVVGDIAIDEISFDNCMMPLKAQRCPPQQSFHCANQRCIIPSRVCDFTDDCGDLSDEANSTCAAYTTCNFENGMCFWSQDQTDDFDWTRHAGTTFTRNTGPSRDHTLNTATGHFMYIETSRPRRQGEKARLTSPFFTANTTSPYCVMTLYYEMFGRDVDSIAVYTRTQVDGTLKSHWGRGGPVGDYFARQQISLFDLNPIQVVIEGTVGRSYHGDIAIDDISFTPACKMYNGSVVTAFPLPPTTPNPCGTGNFQCSNKLCIPQSQVCDFINQCSDLSDEINCGVCNFETGLCGWSDMSAGLYAWERHNGTTTSLVSGPLHDHTYGTTRTGNYIYVDAAKGTFAYLADLVSPVYGAIGSSCDLQFAYHKKGDLGGLMRLYLIPPGNQPTSQISRILLWSATGDQGNSWQVVHVGIGSRAPGYRLVFEAVKHQQTGDMAIDDIKFNTCAFTAATGNCSTNQFTCPRKSCVDKSLVCDWSNDCGDWGDEASCAGYVGRCNFETDICNWIQDDSDNFNWSWNSGETQTSGTGPRLDHTYGNATGHYIFIETSWPQKPGYKARLKSPVFQPTMTGTCALRFFYHMYGRDVNSLNVYTEVFEMGPMVRLWNKTGQQRDSWTRMDIPLSGQSPFRVIIEAVVGNGYKGDIGVDDISFTPGCQMVSEMTLPPKLTTPSVCGPGKLPCTNSQCVSANAFCNFRYECTDRSDESNCPTLATFESGTLEHWYNDFVQNSFNWTVNSNGNPTALTGPATDHTYGNASGNFALMKGQMNNQAISVGRLVSPIYNQAGQTCNFNFSYHVHGSEFSSLSVYIRRGSTKSNIWSIGLAMATGIQDTWQLAQIALPICASEFQMIVEVSGYGTKNVARGFVAIDDLQFINCEYPTPAPTCMMGQYQCRSGNCIPKTSTCDLQTDCCDGSDETQSVCAGYTLCDFEFGMCGWQQATNDKFDWQRHRGETTSDRTGPSQDHTSGSRSGYYLFIESSYPRMPHDTARIQFNLPAPSGVCAIRFWYHMYGINIGALNVYMNTLNSGMLLMSATNGIQGNRWILKSVTLNSTTPFQVIIEGVTGIGYNGDIAIDDISLTPGCGVPTTGQSPFTYPTPSQRPGSTPNPCGYGKFTCTSGQCIDVASTCNSINDCTDHSDEQSCPQSCSFENDKCGWIETIMDDLDWVRARGSQISVAGLTNRAPTTDNTRHTQNGYFMYVNDSTTGSTQNKVAQFVSPTLYSPVQECKVQFAYYLNGNDQGQLILQLQQAGSPTIPLWRRQETASSTWKSVTVGIGKRTSPFQLAFSRTSSQYTGQTAIDDIRYLDCKPPAPQTFCSASLFKCANKACIGLQYVCDMTWDCGDKSDEGSQCRHYRFNNFENGLGDFSQVKNGDDDFDWTTVSTTRNFSFTGPIFDHTTEAQTGKYMYIDSTNHIYNSLAWLRTSTFQPVAAGANCRIRFYLFMSGQNVNAVNVYYRLYNSGPPTKSLRTVTGEQGAYWQRIDIPVVISQPFQIIIEAKAGHKDVGGVAIDDLSFTPGCRVPSAAQLPTPPTTVSTTPPLTTTMSPNNCTGDQTSCKNDSMCIDSNMVCDFKNDCADGSDETYCVATSCGFGNQQTCGWSIGSNKATRADETFIWRIRVAQTLQGTIYAPTNDHTQGNPTGSLALAMSTTGRFHDMTELYTPTIGKTGPQCRFRFYYYMDGSSVGALTVKIQVNGIETSLWEVSGSRGRVWQVADVFIGSKIRAVLSVQARRASSYSGGISIDDLQFIDCQPPKVTAYCPPTSFQCSNQYCIDSSLRCNYADDCGDKSDEVQRECDSLFPGRCDFTHGICNVWSNDIDDSFDWTFERGSTPTLGTGPSVDHTTRTASGGYIYTNSAPPRKTGDTARLSSFTIGGRSRNCMFRLWYHMWGSDIGYLTVQQRFNYTFAGLVPVHTLSGDHGDDWHLWSVPLSSSSNKDFQVVIQGTVGKGVHNDIAIDDLSLTPGCETSDQPLPGSPTQPTTTVGKCVPGQKQCATTTKCYTYAQECDFIDSCGDNSDEAICGTSCNFENSTCGWTNSVKDNTDWVVMSGATAGRLGPDKDHTTNSAHGHYFLAQNRASSSTGDTAILDTSKYFESSSTCALSFWYNSVGSVGTLMSILLKTSQGQLVNMWTHVTNNTVSWQKATMTIGSYNKFSIVLEVVFPNGGGGVIAIDDISFSKCARVNEVGSCKLTQFMCGNRIDCIERRYRCDGQTDCSDGTDEDTCIPNLGDCNFNSDSWLSVCKWQQRQGDDADWAQGGSRMNPRTGADSPHKSYQGSYFLTTNSAQMKPGDIASIQGPAFPNSHNLCYVRFFYYMYGSQDIGPLRVYTYNSNGEKTLMWSVSGNKGQQWNYANVLVGNNKNFSVLFEATSEGLAISDVAIDDVSVSPECATGKNITIPTRPVCNPQTSFFCNPRLECLPSSWMCDGVQDCSDGTDEPPSCPSRPTLPSGATTSSPKALPSTKKVITPPVISKCPPGHFQCANKLCIFGVLQCDTIKDCADGSDEVNCHKCKADFVYCRKQRLCIKNDTLCDHNDDCGDQSDESFCSTVCSSIPNFCQNGAACVDVNGILSCTCSGTYQGFRCQYKTPEALNSTGSNPGALNSTGSNGSNGTGWKAGVGVSVGLLGIFLIVVGGFLFFKRRRALLFFRNVSSEGGLSNPVYDSYGTGDVDTTDFQMSSMDTSTSIENPLYSDA